MSEANDKDDDALDSYLSGDSEVSRRYRSGGAPRPSASVDRAILDAARAEVAPTAPRRRRWKPTWERPLAIAAAVALSAILFVSIQREAGVFPPGDGETERSLDHRDGATAPAIGRAEPRPAAPDQQDKRAMESRVLSDAPVSSEAARSGKGPAARGIFANGLLNEAAEPELESLAADDSAIEDALADIKSAWASESKERAQELLEAFREEYPDVGEERLRETLPPALLKKE